MPFTFKLAKRLARCKATPITAARGLSTSRRAPTFLPSFVLPSTTVSPSQSSPSVPMDCFAVQQNALAEEILS
jgi:hypothetical protein